MTCSEGPSLEAWGRGQKDPVGHGAGRNGPLAGARQGGPAPPPAPSVRASLAAAGQSPLGDLSLKHHHCCCGLSRLCLSLPDCGSSPLPSTLPCLHCFPSSPPHFTAHPARLSESLLCHLLFLHLCPQTFPSSSLSGPPACPPLTPLLPWGGGGAEHHSSLQQRPLPPAVTVPLLFREQTDDAG